MRRYTVMMMALLCAATYSQQAWAGLKIRVLLEESEVAVKIRGLDLEIMDVDSRSCICVSSIDSVVFKASGNRLRCNAEAVPSGRAMVSSPSGFLFMNDREFHSPIEVRYGSDLMVINHMELETYLIGTLGGEMPSDWPLEALKAQAIASRTYALGRVRSSRLQPFDVASDVRDQVYAGARSSDVRAAAAVKATEGLVLMHNGKLVEAFFHSTCGGITEDPHAVWKKAESAKPVACRYCQKSPALHWSQTLSATEIARLLKPLNFNSDVVLEVNILSRTASGRARDIEVVGEAGKIVVEANAFRNALGYFRVRSARFVCHIDDGMVTFEGDGFGHGAGMCQWGARGMALVDHNAESIVKHYFPGSEIVRLVSEL